MRRMNPNCRQRITVEKRQDCTHSKTLRDSLKRTNLRQVLECVQSLPLFLRSIDCNFSAKD
jgi:hypothetical protein